MNLGRPTAIPDNINVSAPVDLDDEYITAHGYAAQPTWARSRTAFFVQLVTFCTIMKDVQRTLYPQDFCRDSSRRLSAPPTFGEAVRLDQTLLEWYQAVPTFLKCRGRDETDTSDWIRNVLLSR
jgi:hypothetical protein